MSEMCERLLDHVREHPGRHASALGREFDLATGQRQYHLRRLRRAGSVVADERHGRTHYFPPGYDERERERLALARRGTSRAALAALLAGETPASDRLVDRLGRLVDELLDG